MSFVRPEVLAALYRWREVAGFAALGATGLWLLLLGGVLLTAIGLLFVGTAATGALLAWRRVRFARDVDQPGVVEVDEGQIRYFGPHGGGFVAIPELQRLDILPDPAGQLWWRLHPGLAAPLSIPVGAQGAEALFDAFSALPGLTPAALVAAVESGTAVPLTVWSRTRRAALT